MAIYRSVNVKAKAHALHKKFRDVSSSILDVIRNYIRPKPPQNPATYELKPYQKINNPLPAEKAQELKARIEASESKLCQIEGKIRESEHAKDIIIDELTRMHHMPRSRKIRDLKDFDLEPYRHCYIEIPDIVRSGHCEMMDRARQIAFRRDFLNEQLAIWDNEKCVDYYREKIEQMSKMIVEYEAHELDRVARDGSWESDGEGEKFGVIRQFGN